MDKIRVLVADDQEIVRRGLTIIIDQQPDMEMVAQAEDGEEAIRLARTYKPDVVLMDIKMPRMNGIQANPNHRGLNSLIRTSSSSPPMTWMTGYSKGFAPVRAPIF